MLTRCTSDRQVEELEKPVPKLYRTFVLNHRSPAALIILAFPLCIDFPSTFPPGKNRGAHTRMMVVSILKQAWCISLDVAPTPARFSSLKHLYWPMRIGRLSACWPTAKYENCNYWTVNHHKTLAADNVRVSPSHKSHQRNIMYPYQRKSLMEQSILYPTKVINEISSILYRDGKQLAQRTAGVITINNDNILVWWK